MQNDLVSIVIPVYNQEKELEDALRSIENQTYKDLEIIVVDNNSKDNSVETIKKSFPQIKIIENNYNARFSAGINQGAKIAKGKYLFVLNPDTEFIEDSLTIILNEIKTHKDFGVIGPALINSNTKIQQSF